MATGRIERRLAAKWGGQGSGRGKPAAGGRWRRYQASASHHSHVPFPGREAWAFVSRSARQQVRGWGSRMAGGGAEDDGRANS